MLLGCLLTLTVAVAQPKEGGKAITYQCENEKLSTALRQVERLSEYYKIQFALEDVEAYKVNVKLKNASIEKAMAELLKKTQLTYELNGQFVQVYSPKTVAKQSGKSTISGRVLDNTGYPLPGVAIQIKGTTKGAVTDVDGFFNIPGETQDGATLLVSFVGMKDKAVQWKGRPLNITMEEDAAAIDEVVVTGIFSKAKESFTGAASTVTKEQLQMYKGQNLLQTLKNIDASINFVVDNINGSDPNRVPTINIRGNASLPTSLQEYSENVKNDANTPLIIMDGFEIELTRLMDYNDDEIEKITILKDASATAIYGSRGSNGVIVVTTKQPEAGKLRLNLEVGLDIEAPDLTSYDLLNAADKLNLEYQVGLYHNDVAPSNDVWNKEAYFKRLRDVMSGVDTDWLGKPLHTGLSSHYNLRMEGGSDEFRWSASAQYKGIEGAMKGSDRRTFNGSITLMYKVKNLIFKNQTSWGLTRGQNSKYGAFSTYVDQQPYNAPYDTEGNLVRYFDGFLAQNPKVQNPLYDATLNTFDKSSDQTLTNNFSVEWNILKELTLRGQLALTTKTSNTDAFYPAEHSMFNSGDNSTYYETDEGKLRKGQYNYGDGRSYRYAGNVTLAYSNTFADKHQIYAGADVALEQTRSRNYSFVAEGFTNEDLANIISARQYQLNGSPTGSMSTLRRLGLTGNINYIYDNRYYVDLSARIDGSSSFGSEKKYAPFWSVGVGWNLHSEKFLRDTKVNTLRLKASYGVTGSQEGSSVGSKTVYNYVTGNRYMNWTGATLAGWGNPFLTWQETEAMNVGVEFGFFENRLKGTFDVYTKKTGNLLSYLDIPSSMGFSSYLANVGEVKNNGWEASLNGYIIRDSRREMNLIVGAQLVYNKNYISKLSDAIKEQTATALLQGAEIANLLYEGKPQNSIYAVRSHGIDPSTGKEVFIDKDGNLTDEWKASDKVYLGSTDPKYRGNANVMFQWKAFTFNMSFGYQWGGKCYNSTLLDRVEVTKLTLKYQNVDSRVWTDRWMQPGDVTFFKGLSDTETKATSRFVMDYNMLSLQSMSLQYRWDADWVRRNLRMQSITFGVNMSDIATWQSIGMERGLTYPYARNIQGSIKFLF